MRSKRIVQASFVLVLLASTVLLLGACGVEIPYPSETVTPSPEAEWSEVALPSGIRLWCLSPDLRWIIYDDSLSFPAGAPHGRYWIAGIEDGELTEPALIAEWTEDQNVYPRGFSPDSSGFLIRLSSSEDQFSEDELWLVNVTDVQDRQLVYAGPGPLHGASWAPDSYHIAVFTADWGADLVTLDGTTREDILPPGTHAPLLSSLSWSPTSEQIVYPELHESLTVTVWIADLVTGGRHVLVTNTQSLDPVWSPDGEHIALLGFVNDTPRLEVVDTEGRTRASVELPQWPNRGAGVWSPNGLHFAFVLRGETETPSAYLGMVTLPTGDFSTIPLESSSLVYGWTPDSKHVIVSGSRDGVRVLRRVQVVP